MKLTGETTKAPTTGERVPINITPEAKGALERILWHPHMRGVGFSEFILRAVHAAEEELQESDAYIQRRRRLIKDFHGPQMTDEEADALIAKLDAARAVDG